MLLNSFSIFLFFCWIILFNVVGTAASVVASYFFIELINKSIFDALSNNTKVEPTKSDTCKQPNPKEWDRGKGTKLISDSL